MTLPQEIQLKRTVDELPAKMIPGQSTILTGALIGQYLKLVWR
jgi:hypothetical protein